MSFLWRWIKRSIVVALAALLAYLAYQPDVVTLRTQNPTTTALIQLRIEQAQKAHITYKTEMSWRDMDHISPNLVHAVLVAEDDMFYQHNGFDVNEIKEAVRINWEKKRWAYGASTITQQLARTLYLSPRKNLLRKLKEAILTVRLEQTLSKKRILEIYLNVAEWGRGIYGAEAASQFYYGKPASDLTPDEAASLASILPSPRRWSPTSEKAFMARRRSQLLARMRQAGYMPDEVTASVDPFDPSLPTLETSEPVMDGLQGEADVHEAAPQYP